MSIIRFMFVMAMTTIVKNYEFKLIIIALCVIIIRQFEYNGGGLA